MKSNFRNFSRSSFKTSIPSVKQSSQMRLPRGRRSDTETESEFSTSGSTEAGCLSGLASEVVSSCKQSRCMRYLAHQSCPMMKETFHRTRRHGCPCVTTLLWCRCGPIQMDGSMPPRRFARRGKGGEKKPRSRYVRRAHGSYAVLPRQAYEADLRMLPEDGWIRADLNSIHTMFVEFVWGAWISLASRLHGPADSGELVAPGRGNVTSILRSDT